MNRRLLLYVRYFQQDFSYVVAVNFIGGEKIQEKSEENIRFVEDH